MAHWEILQELTLPEIKKNQCLALELGSFNFENLSCDVLEVWATRYENLGGRKYLIKVSQPQKPLSGSNQISPVTSGKKDTSSNLRGHCKGLYVAAAAAATLPAQSNIPICRYY